MTRDNAFVIPTIGRAVLRALPALLALALANAATATPPPPPPMGILHGPQALCSLHYGLRLAEGETARQYAQEWWVVTAPGLELGVRTDLQGLDGTTANVTLAGLGSGEAQPVLEWPGNRPRGWIYAFRMSGGSSPAILRIASDQFDGSDADYSILRRVLIGSARDELCASRS
jgi:hypothetical protein